MDDHAYSPLVGLKSRSDLHLLDAVDDLLAHGVSDFLSMYLGILRYMDRFVQQGYAVRHPKAILKDLAGTRKMMYDTRRIPREIEHQCWVDFDGEELAGVTSCATPTEAVLAVATPAKTHMIG